MLTQNFCNYLRRSASSLRRSVCVFISCIRAQKYMPVLICMALMLSSNSYSYSFTGLINYAISITQGSYQAKLNIEDDPDKAVLIFSGNTPKSLNGYDRYTIHSFDLTIGGEEYPVTDHGDYTQLARIIKLENLNYPLDNFPESKLVFTYSLSGSQYIIEKLKCISAHSNWALFWWDMFFKPELKACFQKAWAARLKTKDHSITITKALVKAISDKNKDLDDLTKKYINDRHVFPYRKIVRVFDYGSWPEDISDEDKQVMTTYGMATYDYFYKDSKLILDAYNRKNFIINWHNILHNANQLDHLDLILRSVKSFKSENCADDLENNLPITMSNGDLQLALSAKKYAAEVCQYNPISFDHMAANPPTKPRDYHKNSGTNIDPDSSTFLPHAFCDKYNCVIRISETLSYKIVFDFYMNHLFVIYNIRKQFRLNSEVPESLSKCVKYCDIDDVDALQIEIKKLMDFATEISRDYIIIEHKN